MKKIITTITIAMLSTIVATAENQKVAVFDPAGNAENFVKEIVREEISSIIVNTSGYTVLERSLIDRVLEENRFQAGGLVDDAQISEMGRRMGANLAFVTNMTRLSDSSFHLSFKMIDVQTARIERQSTVHSDGGATALIRTVRQTVGEMFRETSRNATQTTFTSNRPLVLSGIKVYQGGRRLSPMEVQDLMGGSDAFQLYMRGASRNRTANILFYSLGGAVFAGSIIGGMAEGSFGTGMAIGATVTTFFGGVLLGTPAIILKSRGKRDIRDAVNIHNRSLNRAEIPIELNFGITQNGVGLVLNF